MSSSSASTPGLPAEVAVCAITLAELAAGPHLAHSSSEAARRQDRLQQVGATFEPLPFDAAAARSYGQIVAAVPETGRSHRRRVADLLIAATAHANGLPVYTRNPDDFEGLSDLVIVVGIECPAPVSTRSFMEPDGSALIWRCALPGTSG